MTRHQRLHRLRALTPSALVICIGISGSDNCDLACGERTGDYFEILCSGAEGSCKKAIYFLTVLNS